MRLTRLLVALLFITSLSACNKDEVDLLTQEVNTGTLFDLWDVQFLSDSVGYACGGSYWDKGVCIKSVDGGKTWSDTINVINSGILSMHFFNEGRGILCAVSTQLSATTDSGKTFTNTVIGPEFAAPYQIAFRDAMHGLIAAGTSFGNGIISYTNDGGITWDTSMHTHNFASVCYADDNTAYAGGYGVVYKSTNKGATFTPTYGQGDFFRGIHFFDAQMGIAVGYQGLIIKTYDGGNTWERVKKGNGPFMKREFLLGTAFIGNTGYAYGEYGNMYQSTDAGNNWKRVKQFTDEHIQGIHLFNENSGIVVCTGGKAFLFQR